MNIFKFYSLVILLMSFQVSAERILSPTEEFVKRIETVETAKLFLKSTFEQLDDCRFGSCANNASMGICEIVAALDVRANGVIIGEMSGDKPDITISANDLKYMKKIFNQCKPTNYQYWNYSKVLHIGYRANDKADKLIRKYLGLKY